jgi:succinate-semialdehyde dehydrogenase/glutarate-semialdehyde dehydrogenase
MIVSETGITLKDASLFRQQCYINGEWLDADNKATIEVTNAPRH